MKEHQSSVEPKVPALKPRGTFPQVREVECVKSGAGEHHFPATTQEPPLPSLSPDPGGAGTYEELPGTYHPCFYLLTHDLWIADGIWGACEDPILTPCCFVVQFDTWDTLTSGESLGEPVCYLGRRSVRSAWSSPASTILLLLHQLAVLAGSAVRPGSRH